MPSLDLVAIFYAAVLAALMFSFRLRTARSMVPLPPGPRKLPLVGNLLEMPTSLEWETYSGGPATTVNSDIIHVNAAGTSIVVLSSMEAAEALLEKRSSIYSDRPSFAMIDLMKWDFHLGEPTSRARTNRRLFVQTFNVASAKNFRPKERAATHGLLRRLLHTPEAYRAHSKQVVGEVAMSVAYGIDVLPKDDPYISLGEQAIQSGNDASLPGKFLVDWIPVLKYIPEWFPGAAFKRQVRNWRELAHALTDLPFAEVKRQLAAGTAPHSFATESLQHLSESSSDGAYYPSMYSAGADTLTATLTALFLALLANLQAQRKAQAEIDKVVGMGHLPSFGDEEAMPYVSALVKELMRWWTVTPLELHRSVPIPHFLAVEEAYRGYGVPAGSIVIGNVWAILYDETTYSDPFVFKPERYLLDGKPNPDMPDPRIAFGFGRRICPGRHMVASTVWITVVSVLATFEVAKAIEPARRGGLIIAPLPFKCSILPRSRAAVESIEARAHDI
ncbi:cytochrome P450 [Mycena rosella]|uniref:Cytochrome P450 n=1 Tax=Mycena rosella TaxID=1033263 RepID=A0AAD7FVM8_MYCRO|nr:cytochrome P450 [Mycena rosella]